MKEGITTGEKCLYGGGEQEAEVGEDGKKKGRGSM